jgi:flagellar FliL protein
MTMKHLMLLLGMLLSLTAAPSLYAADEEAPKKPIYYAMEPPFVVNVEEGPRTHFIQVTVQLMTRDEAVIKAVEENQPPLRDALIMLLAHQTGQTMRSVEGREQVRKQALTELRRVLKEVAGIKKGLEAVYFTDFVIQ